MGAAAVRIPRDRGEIRVRHSALSPAQAGGEVDIGNPERNGVTGVNGGNGAGSGPARHDGWRAPAGRWALHSGQKPVEPAGRVAGVPSWLVNAWLIATVTAVVVGVWWLAVWASGGVSSGWAGRILAVAGAAVLARAAGWLWPRSIRVEAVRESGATGPRVESRNGHRDPAMRVASRLRDASTLEEVLAVVSEETARGLRTPVAVFLANRETDQLALTAAHGMPATAIDVWPTVSRTRMDAVFAESGIAVIEDVREGGLPGAEIHVAVGVRSVALAKMTRAGEPVGVLAALSLDERRLFSQEDLDVLRCVADQATQAVSSAKLVETTQRRLHMTQGLRNIDIAIAGSMDLRVTLNVILHETVRQLKVDAASVMLLDRHSQTLGFAAGHGFRSRQINDIRMRIGEGHAGRVVLERMPLRASLRLNPCPRRAAILEGEAFEAYYGLPLVAKGVVKGVLEIFHRGRLEPDADWSAYAEAIAGQAAIAIDSATLFEELQHVNANLVQAYDSTLEGWSRALDLRDRETEGHTQRVTDLALTLGREVGIGGDELVHMRRGAMLHDIGKMGIPDSILLKPGPLSDDEWRVMRQHPVLAYELLAPISYLRPAIDIPYCHHERWDGTGYPRGLRADDIPLTARVFAVVDVWDALLSDRPYRKAWSTESAREYIHSLRGAHFDPTIVDLFERVYQA